jgi:hypothetical protein
MCWRMTYLFTYWDNRLSPLTRHAVNTCPFDENVVLVEQGRR